MINPPYAPGCKPLPKIEPTKSEVEINKKNEVVTTKASITGNNLENEKVEKVDTVVVVEANCADVEHEPKILRRGLHPAKKRNSMASSHKS